ncbi:MAG: hypothetical protein E6G68_10690 [Actinobacteria bacterium]|nr:MAG: hypothetical protein E6G68_10690 [Actinomycetota bacterium]
MTDNAPKQRRFLTLRFLMVVVALVSLLTLTTALATKGHQKRQLPIAQGIVDGSFHPIAGKFVPNKTKLDDCASTDQRCLEQGFGNLAYSEGPRGALKLFNQRRVVDKTVAHDCHRIAHIIGSAALAYWATSPRPIRTDLPAAHRAITTGFWSGPSSTSIPREG